MEIRSDVRIYSGIFLVLLAAAAVIIFFKSKNPPLPKISNFQECAAAGYPVMQSYPRQCGAPGGRMFIEQTVARECVASNECPAGQTCQNHFCQ